MVGVLLWDELQGASWKAKGLFAGMLVSYTGAVVLISLS